MKVKCSYCGQYFDDSIAQCPSCGAPNDQIRRTAFDVPQTLGELQAYCEQNGLTPERTRFFVGVDYRKPRAFGIYQNDRGEFVVYKNKADGSRAVRYRGRDEAYAVNQLYERLQSEILNQKAQYVERRKNDAVRSVRQQETLRKRSLLRICLFLFAAVIAINVIMALAFSNERKNGYYQYNGSSYYSLDDNWYYYDDGLTDWYPVYSVPGDLADNAADYYDSSYYSYSYDATDFSDTDYYSDWEETRSSSDDDDDDWGWSSSDWDSGGTDWDSDW